MASRTPYSTWTSQNSTLFDGHYLRNRLTLDIGVLGYIGIVQHKEHSPEVLSIPPGRPCIGVVLRFVFCMRGVFKKRPNFLNSAPTSTEDALPLGALSDRSAPSVLVGALFKKFGFFLNIPRIYIVIFHFNYYTIFACTFGSQNVVCFGNVRHFPFI